MLVSSDLIGQSDNFECYTASVSDHITLKFVVEWDIQYNKINTTFFMG